MGLGPLVGCLFGTYIWLPESHYTQKPDLYSAILPRCFTHSDPMYSSLHRYVNEQAESQTCYLMSAAVGPSPSLEAPDT